MMKLTKLQIYYEIFTAKKKKIADGRKLKNRKIKTKEIQKETKLLFAKSEKEKRGTSKYIIAGDGREWFMIE